MFIRHKIVNDLSEVNIDADLIREGSDPSLAQEKLTAVRTFSPRAHQPRLADAAIGRGGGKRTDAGPASR